MTSEELSADTTTPSAHIMLAWWLVRKRPTTYSDQYPNPLGVFSNSQRRTGFLSLRLGNTRITNRDQAHLSPRWSPPALTFRHNNLSRVPSWQARLHISPRVALRVDPPATKVKVAVCPKYREGIRGITLEGFPLEELHDRSLSEVMKEDSPSVTHNRIAILQRHHRK